MVAGPPMGRTHMTFATLERWYRNTALVVLNTLVALVVINVALYAVITARYRWFHPARDNPVVKRYIDRTWSEVYPEMSEDSIYVLLDETWSRRQRYDPITQFAERAFRGHFVNVSEHGFREHSDQGPWPPDDRFYNVFLFGGSTAFGYGVTDDHALGACLQRSMNAASGRKVFVYNFGNASFTSAQERARFEQLLFDGFVPDQAVFVDGINEFAFPFGTADTKRLRALYERDPRELYLESFELLPMVRAGRAIKRRIVDRINRGTNVKVSNRSGAETEEIVERALRHYLANRSLIEGTANSYGVSAVFVWEPAPMYKYDLSYHPFAAWGFPNNPHARAGYEHFARWIEREPLGKNFIWCADMQESLHEPLYIDRIHYAPAMNHLLCEEIVSRMSERGMLGAAGRKAEVPGNRREVGDGIENSWQ